MNEKEIILKLLAVATKQQKILHKLAELSPVESYLKETVNIAMGNSNISSPFNVFVKTNPGVEEGNSNIGGTYTVMISGINNLNNAAKQNLINNYNNIVKTQKPELDGKVSILFS